MNNPKPTRCCPTCGGLFPIPAHYGLASNVYCLEPEHWRAVGLNPAEVMQAFEAFQQQRASNIAKLRAATAELRESLKEPSPSTPPAAAPGDDDAAIHARFVRMLKWLDEPPSGTA